MGRFMERIGNFSSALWERKRFSYNGGAVLPCRPNSRASQRRQRCPYKSVSKFSGSSAEPTVRLMRVKASEGIQTQNRDWV